MRSIRTKLLLALVIITLLPVYPLYHLVKNFFVRSLEVGYNEKVVAALENASGLSQIVFAHFRDETVDLCHMIQQIVKVSSQFPTISRRNIDKIEKSFGAIRIVSFDSEGNRNWQQTIGDTLVYPQIFAAQKHRMQAAQEVTFFETDPQPEFISAYIPLFNSGKKTGALVVTRPLPAAFVQQSQQVIEVNQMFQAIGILRGDLENSFILAFFVIYSSLVLLIIGLGWIISRRISRPLIALAAGTEKVAAGDLDYRMKIKSRDEIGKLVDAFNSMIEKVKFKQEQVIELEKKAAWREMARILAHEIKNPLTPIQLTVQQLRDEYQGENPAYDRLLKECTEIILDEITALQKLVRAFSDFARMPEMQLAPEQLNDIIRDVGKLHKDAPIDLKLDGNLPKIHLDEQQIRRVLKNLFKNSLESIAEKGRGKISVQTVLQENSILLQFKDTGRGIENEVLQRIFEPHYSTKKHGMGLGLAIVQRIIHEHGGTIKVESKVGQGTTFIIVLPLTTGNVDRAGGISMLTNNSAGEK